MCNLGVHVLSYFHILQSEVYFLDVFRGSRFPENVLNGAEMQLFRLPAFNTSNKTIPPLLRFPTTFAEAGSRLVYTAVHRACNVSVLYLPASISATFQQLHTNFCPIHQLNYEKVPGPNNGFGDITLVLNRSNVSNMTVSSAMARDCIAQEQSVDYNSIS